MQVFLRIVTSVLLLFALTLLFAQGNYSTFWLRTAMFAKIGFSKVFFSFWLKFAPVILSDFLIIIGSILLLTKERWGYILLIGGCLGFFFSGILHVVTEYMLMIESRFFVLRISLLVFYGVCIGSLLLPKFPKLFAIKKLEIILTILSGLLFGVLIFVSQKGI